MAYAFPDFVVVVHADQSNYKAIVDILNKNRAVALNMLTYAEWLEDAYMLKYNLLFVRSDGTWLYAKEAIAKGRIKKEIESILDRQAYMS
jgi:hypothetical protein